MIRNDFIPRMLRRFAVSNCRFKVQRDLLDHAPLAGLLEFSVLTFFEIK